MQNSVIRNGERACTTCYSWESECACRGKKRTGEKRERKSDISHTHLGFYLASTLCSAPTLWRQQASHPASVFLIPSDVGKLLASPLLVSDILHLPREAGQPCRSNVKHMWNRPGHEQTNTHTHTNTQHGGGQNRTGLSSHCVLG